MPKKQIVNCPLCSAKLELQKNEKWNFYYLCKNCNLGGKGKDAETARDNLIKKSKQSYNMIKITLPDKKNIQEWANNNMNALIASSAQFIDKPETRRMIQKNIRYIANADLKKVWNTPDGVLSIVEAFTDALYYGATLPEMGSIVPFGSVAEFIPAISAFEFALTSGKNAPLKNLSIDCIYENDQYEATREDGNFHFKFKSIGLPRGEVLGIVVQAFDIERKAIIGDIYDAERLMKKAEQHSRSYQYYLKDLKSLREAQSEENDFFEKVIKGDKGEFKIKITEDDIKNPYVGADRPEMLRKVAGKSFFRPFMKIRNARAASNEWREQGNIKDAEEVYTKTLDESLEAIKDAEFNFENESDFIKSKTEPDEENLNINEENQKEKKEKNKEQSEEKDLFQNN
jgi:hypothetical protein